MSSSYIAKFCNCHMWICYDALTDAKKFNVSLIKGMFSRKFFMLLKTQLFRVMKWFSHQNKNKSIELRLKNFHKQGLDSSHLKSVHLVPRIVHLNVFNVTLKIKLFLRWRPSTNLSPVLETTKELSRITCSNVISWLT